MMSAKFSESVMIVQRRGNKYKVLPHKTKAFYSFQNW